MLILNKILFAFCYFVFAICSVLKVNKLVWVLELIFLVSSIWVFNLISNISCTLSDYILRMVVGLAISPLLTIVTYLMVFAKMPDIKLTLNIPWELLLEAIWEELIWRDMFFLWLMELPVNIVMNTVLSVIVIILFVLSHSNCHSMKDRLEMFLYSGVIMVVAYFYPGMNLGLHLGRNIVCNAAKELKNESIKVK